MNSVNAKPAKTLIMTESTISISGNYNNYSTPRLITKYFKGMVITSFPLITFKI